MQGHSILKLGNRFRKIERMTEKILLNSLERHNRNLLPEFRHALDRVLESGWYILGSEVDQFESEFADYCGVSDCVGVGNGTDALELALLALEIGPGNRVATVANAGGYSSTAIRAIGAIPVYVDIATDTMTMSPDSLAQTLTPDIRAVIVTHLYGQMADMAPLLRAAGKFGIPVIEDCAQAHGAIANGKKAGAHGIIGCFSFYPTKNLGALGDGGALTTSDAGLARRLRQLRQYGWEKKYDTTLTGGRNSRLDEMQAALLRIKLPLLDEWNARRREIAGRYSVELASSQLVLPSMRNASYVAHLYVCRTQDRQGLQQHLAAQGVMTDIHYPIPDHLQPAFRSPQPPDLPVTERCCEEVLTLPCYPELTEADVLRVIDACLSWSP